MTNIEADLIALLDEPTNGLKPARARFRDFYDDWLHASNLSDGPSGFIHAVVSTNERLKSADGAEYNLNIEDTRDAMLLALASLKSKEHILACFSAAVSAGLFDIGTTKSDVPKFRSKITKAVHKALRVK